MANRACGVSGRSAVLSQINRYREVEPDAEGDLEGAAILQRLLRRWAGQAKRGSMPGLGYPSQSVEHRAIHGRGGGGSDWPLELAAVEAAVNTLHAWKPILALTVRTHYLTVGVRMPERAAAHGVGIARYRNRLQRAEAYLAAALRETIKEFKA